MIWLAIIGLFYQIHPVLPHITFYDVYPFLPHEAGSVVYSLLLIADDLASDYWPVLPFICHYYLSQHRLVGVSIFGLDQVFPYFPYFPNISRVCACVYVFVACVCVSVCVRVVCCGVCALLCVFACCV
jgi:hypothetical protein